MIDLSCGNLAGSTEDMHCQLDCSSIPTSASDGNLASGKLPQARLFATGEIVATPNVLCTVPGDEIDAALLRHMRGDWGELDPPDAAANKAALGNGARLASRYRSASGIVFWIITEADRSSTTVLLPEDY